MHFPYTALYAESVMLSRTWAALPLSSIAQRQRRTSQSASSSQASLYDGSETNKWTVFAVFASEVWRWSHWTRSIRKEHSSEARRQSASTPTKNSSTNSQSQPSSPPAILAASVLLSNTHIRNPYQHNCAPRHYSIPYDAAFKIATPRRLRLAEDECNHLTMIWRHRSSRRVR